MICILHYSLAAAIYNRYTFKYCGLYTVLMTDISVSVYSVIPRRLSNNYDMVHAVESHS